MKRNLKFGLLMASGGLALALGFQNCSPNGKSGDSLSLSGNNGNPTDQAPPSDSGVASSTSEQLDKISQMLASSQPSAAIDAMMQLPSLATSGPDQSLMVDALTRMLEQGLAGMDVNYQRRFFADAFLEITMFETDTQALSNMLQQVINSITDDELKTFVIKFSISRDPDLEASIGDLLPSA